MARTSFSLGFSSHAALVNDDQIQERKASLRGYYEQQFGAQFNQLNNGQGVDIDKPTEGDSGPAHFVFKDPDGNVIMFDQHV